MSHLTTRAIEQICFTEIERSDSGGIGEQLVWVTVKKPRAALHCSCLLFSSEGSPPSGLLEHAGTCWAPSFTLTLLYWVNNPEENLAFTTSGPCHSLTLSTVLHGPQRGQ